LLLTTEERARVRAALAELVGPSNAKALHSFADWLSASQRERGGEFVYIVDGANVAYHKQNFDEGKFSFRQIELVVEKLKQRLQPGERILVLIPWPYAQKVIPNSTKHKRGKKVSYLTAEDSIFLERLEREGMLFVVPQWANDDWYWMYATVNEGRQQMARVVTNDLMRDHRLAFLEPRPFIRWRNSQVIRFDLTHAAVDQAVAAAAIAAAGSGVSSVAVSDKAPSSSAAASPSLDTMHPEVILTDPGECECECELSEWKECLHHIIAGWTALSLAI